MKEKNEKGITLIALVVTIVVLLILAGITINLLFSNGGIFKTAQDAANVWNEATINEQASLENIADQIENLVSGQVGGETGTGGGDEVPEKPEVADITTVTEIVQKEEGEKAKDAYGNVVVVPKGFKVVISEGATVPEGIVIEDANGNQFVWIPVGTVYKDSTGTNTSTIKLGRYTFDETNGTPTMQQAAFAGDNENNPSQTYASDPPVTINLYYTELSIYQEGTVSEELKQNATAQNLKKFVESVRNNGGYYLGRYESSYGSGENISNFKPLSKMSTANNESNMNYKTGTLWNYITQPDASKVSQNMYKNDDSVGVISDLVNSYAYDTAIVFIEKMKNNNYANTTRDTIGNTNLMNTGTTGDKMCNIFDMTSNLREWSTECSKHEYGPYTFSGNAFVDSLTRTGDRNCSSYANLGNGSIGFRLLLYIK